MSHIVLNPNSKIGVHAFVIGVGDYENVTRLQDLGLEASLRAPVTSALSFANWLVGARLTPCVLPPRERLGILPGLRGPNDAYTGICAPQKELASLWLHTSPTTNVEIDGQCVESLPATFQSIKVSFNEFFRAVNGHRDNLGLLYFCGHGIEQDRTFILPADFSPTSATPWDNSIDLSTTLLAMQETDSSFCCFIDACRENDECGNSQLSCARGNPLRDPTRRGKRKRLPVFHATQPGHKAYARGPVTLFTKSLVDALESGAAEKRDGQWVVRLSSLHGKLCDLMDWHFQIDKYTVEQLPALEGLVRPTNIIHVRQRDPYVYVEVAVLPDDLYLNSDVKVYEVDDTTVKIQSRCGENVPLRAAVTQGQYKVEIADRTGNVSANHRIELYPPVARIKVSI